MSGDFSPEQKRYLEGFTTGLQVVKNPGWLLPYFSCFFVALGMLIHFGIHLVGFVSRSIA